MMLLWSPALVAFTQITPVCYRQLYQAVRIGLCKDTLRGGPCTRAWLVPWDFRTRCTVAWPNRCTVATSAIKATAASSRDPPQVPSSPQTCRRPCCPAHQSEQSPCLLPKAQTPSNQMSVNRSSIQLLKPQRQPNNPADDACPEGHITNTPA